MATRRIGMRYRTLFSIVFVLSLAGALWTTRTDPLLSFYSIHTRAWELAAGAGVAMWLLHRGDTQRGGARRHDLFTGIALALLVALLMFFPEATPHPGLATLLPVGATVVLVAFMRPGGVAYRLLSSRLFVQIGLMSYGLYLYHNPIFSYIDVYFDYLGDGTRLYKLASLPLVFLLAFASLHLIERPLRRGQWPGQRAILGMSGLGVLATAAIGFLIHVQNGFQSQIADYYARQGVPLLVDVELERGKIDAVRPSVAERQRPYACEGADCRRTLVLGDSLAEDTYMALDSQSSGTEYRYLYIDDPCMGGIPADPTAWNAIACNDDSVDLDALLRNADTVMITAKWQETTYNDGYEFAVRIHEALGKTVVMLGSALFSDLGSMSIKAWRNGYDRTQLDHAFYQYQRWDRLRTSEKLKALVEADPGLIWIDRHGFFCDDAAETCQLLDPSGQPMIWDNAYLTTRAFAPYADFVTSHLTE